MKGKNMFYLFIALIVTGVLVFLCTVGIGKDSKTLSVGNIKLGLDLSGGASILYEADKETVTEEEMAAAVSLIQGRLDRKGWTEAECSKSGEKRILVEIPGVSDAEEAIEELGQTAQLKFVDMDGNVLLTGADVANATKEAGDVTGNGVSEPYVKLQFTNEGKTKFAEATKNNIGKQIAIVLDETVQSAPTVNAEITDGNAVITGSFTPEAAEELAALIRAGSLPFNLNVIQMKNVGARLGADALSTSINAGILGIALVLVFMLAVYKISGLAADWALIIYICLELIVINVFNITLTLSGIAGIVLSIGMAVDANVIIFERIKEELLNGRTLRSAVDSGFKRAFPAIFDGNITTLIAAGVLFFIGTGTVKGFAQTLMIGIIISMFTALVVTRIILKGIMGVGVINPKYYGLRIK